jgi:hypothetical protein
MEKKMKKLLMVLVLMTLTIGLIFAQDTPQIAYFFLDDYITEKENSSSRTTGAIVSFSIGGVMLAGSAVAWFWGDDISMALSEDGSIWDPTTKYITTGALAAGGLLTSSAGVLLLLVPDPDFRGEYAHIYDEENLVLREAFSAAALKGLAEEGRTDRLVSGWIDLSVPIVTVAAQMASNVSSGKQWHENVFSVSSIQIWQIISGLSEIFFLKSDEEILFEEYKAAIGAISFSSEN